jgi:microcystin-dependent protein
MAINSLTPVGTLIPFMGSFGSSSPTPPAGFLLCNGQSVLKATYLALWNVIGYSYGGSGTNFNVPNLERTVPMGAGGTQVNGPATTVGSTGGVESVTLAVSQIPSHTHNYSGSNSGTTNSGNANITTNVQNQGLTVTYANPVPPRVCAIVTGPSGAIQNATGVSSSDSGHSHGFGYSWSGTTDSGTGGNGSHNNVQPSMTVCYCIRY